MFQKLFINGPASPPRGLRPHVGAMTRRALHGMRAPPLPIPHLFHFQKAYLEHSFDFFTFLCYDFTK